ncbi:MAG: hypothetical protein C7B43_15870 [Sulfobacillus benefaciens]|uniref:Uncharacterized protein n=1 Tax=Sulfobacillus benefaciens TaxID=453960 RepID=A0A2T2WUG0_9FIRM|nr:MAG: hypothetical protein C7B43_15870 [Sulfobacillus benefaciens]
MVTMKNSTNPLVLIVKDWIRYIPTSVIPAMLMLAASAIFTRMFPPHVYGLYSLAIAISIPVVNAFSQPLSQSVGRFYYEFASAEKLQLFQQTISTLLFRVTIVFLPIDILLGLWLLQSHRETPSMVWALMIFMVLRIITASLIPTILFSFQVRRYQIIVLVTAFLGTAVPLTFTMFFGYNISFLLWGNVVGILAFLPTIFWWSKIHLSWPTIKRSGEHILVLHRFLRYGLPFVPWFVSESMLSIGDRYILEWFHGPSSVAVYSVNYAVAQQAIGLLAGPFTTALGPRLVQQWSTNGSEATKTLLANITNIYFIIEGMIVGLLIVNGHSLMSILVGKQYVRGFIIIGPVAVGRAIWGSSMIGHKTMELTERSSLMMWDAGIAAVINIILNLWLVPHYSLMGASIAMIAGYCIYAIMVWYQSKEKLSWDISFGLVIRVILLTSLCVIIVNTINFEHGAILDLFVSTVSFIVLYGFGMATWIRPKWEELKSLFIP